jgi:hypothetical protein
MSEPVSELLARASSRRLLRPGDARSGSTFEQVTIDGQSYFLKRLTPRSDWIMRVTGDHVHRPYLVWKAGVMDQVPACIDHTVVAMEVTGEGDDAELSMLMRDIGAYLVPEGDDVISVDQHHNFIDHMAQLSAGFWGWEDTLGGLTTLDQRLRFFAPENIAAELRADEVPGPLAAADQGWHQLRDRSPLLFKVTSAVHEQPSLVSDPLRTTPFTLLQGDWKMGNLGSHPNGRTILLDWAYPGSGPAAWDLCWYVALNRARLPESKEATFARFASALAGAGVETAGWWDTQLGLCVVGIMAAFGWEKALGDDDELAWWEARVASSASLIGL